jgi:hypothetical protein
MVAHIWGDKPEYFRQMSIGMAKEGFKVIDINMSDIPRFGSKGHVEVDEHGN